MCPLEADTSRFRNCPDTGKHMRPARQPASKNPFSTGQSTSDVKASFKKEMRYILQGWMARRERLEDLTPHQALVETETPDDWMRRCTYRLVKWLILARHHDVLPDLVGEIGKRHGSRHDISDQPFKQALLVMSWWYECKQQEPMMDRQRRAELANAMEYAFRHKVQSKHFKRFCKQSQPKRIAKKLASGHVEPGFTLRTVPLAAAD